MSRLPHHDRFPHSGFTLLELMIVLALLAFLVAIVWPAVRKPLQRSVTQQAARQLVEDLARARLNAIETGRTMVVRFEPGGDRYSIGPADMPTDGELSNGTADSDDAAAEPDGDAPPIELVIEGTLEDDVIFQDPAVADDQGLPLDSTLGDLLADEMAETEKVEPLLQDESAGVGWSAPVLIYPTGRAENASFLLRGPEGYSITVTLRGLTGAVSIGPLEHELRTVEELGAAAESRNQLPKDAVTESLNDQGVFE